MTEPTGERMFAAFRHGTAQAAAAVGSLRAAIAYGTKNGYGSFTLPPLTGEARHYLSRDPAEVVTAREILSRHEAAVDALNFNEKMVYHQLRDPVGHPLPFNTAASAQLDTKSHARVSALAVKTGKLQDLRGLPPDTPFVATPDETEAYARLMPGDRVYDAAGNEIWAENSAPGVQKAIAAGRLAVLRGKAHKIKL